MSFLRSYWWATVIVVILFRWTWRRWRHLASASIGTPTAPAAGAPSDPPAPWHQADVERRFKELQRIDRPWVGIAILIALIAMPLVGPAVIPDLDATLVFFAVTPIAIWVLWKGQQRRQRLARGLGLTCPRCGAGQSIELLYRGYCSQCWARLLDRAGLRPMPKSLVSEGSPLRNAIGLIVLLALIAWSLYHVVQMGPRGYGPRGP
jgi:hypothetical protein